MSRALKFSVVIAAFVFTAACSSSKPTEDGGTGGFTTGGVTGGTGGSGSTGGTTGYVDSGFVCAYDLDCLPWHGLCFDGGCQALPPDGGYFADFVSNTCNPDGGDIQPCSVFATGPDLTYCTDPNGSNLCYCQPDSYFDQGGVCYRAIPQCGPCTTSLDCGGTQTDINLGVGVTCLPVGDGGKDFCLYDYSGRCDHAYSSVTIDGAQYCYPLCNTCPCNACLGNSDCPALDAGVCSKTGACVAPCFVKSDCSGTDVCNVLGKYLNPADGIYYGGGQCGPSCTSSADCVPYQENTPLPQLVCIVDHQYPDGGPELDDAGIPLTASRCRVDGCMNTDQCIPEDTDGGAATWCDTWDNNLCVDTYCQIGVNLSGQAYYQTQCQKGFWCVNDAGLVPQADAGPEHGECTVAPCYVLQAPLAACFDDNFCCGWGDGGFWSSPGFCFGPNGVADAGMCFEAINPPWCNLTCTMTIGDPSCETGYDIAPPGCFTEFAQPIHCEPACRFDWPWMCPAGFSCESHDAVYGPYAWGAGNACDQYCPTTQLDAGYLPPTSMSGPGQSCLCPCLGADVSQCQLIGADPGSVYCDNFGGPPDAGGICSYGNFCAPGGKNVCQPVDGG